MAQREYSVDCMKYRKSTHIASVDVDAIIAEKGACELTIKTAYYERAVDVSGNKTDGYFIEFEEVGIKPMVVNSGNRKKIAKAVQETLKCTPVESRNLLKWVGLRIALKVDQNVKMMGQVVGGIVIDTNYKAVPKKTLTDAQNAFMAVNSRELFVSAMTEYKEFMQNAEILATCKELSVKYPNPDAK